MNDKIQPNHLDRSAYVYVRQSSDHQVRNNHQSRQRQYDLEKRARELNFSSVIVIDEDQGKSGSGTVERLGFQSLLTAVCSGDVGAVFALEASRLARNNRDWHHLVDLCAITETLIVDSEGIYDPRQLNDRLLLGLKGTMSEFELGLLRQRAREAFEMKIKQGHAMWEMPVGLVRTEDDRIEKIADRQVQKAIDGVFKKFRELGSARQTTLWYRDEKVALPEVVPATKGKEVTWKLPSGHRINQILKNPAYAGALAYGKTEMKTTVAEGRARKSGSRYRKDPQKWKVLIIDNHEGYISWDTYLKNRETMKANASQREPAGKGAAKSGPALLAGLLRCRHCGRKLFVGYSGSCGKVPRYNCNGGRTDRGSAACQSLGGVKVDQAVSDTVLDVIQPVGLEAAIGALEQFDQKNNDKYQSLELALEKANYEVSRARRQYNAVDPDNRLVAGELESRWNNALQRVAELEEQLTNCEQQQDTLSEKQQARLMQLGSDLPALWNHKEATSELKKRILRTVIEEIMISDDDEKKHHLLTIQWKGGVHTELKVVRNRPGRKAVETDKTALELIEELSKVCSDQTIAATLNRLGFKTGGGKTWRVHSVQNTRYHHKLTNHYSRKSQKPWLTVAQAATESEVSQTVIRRLIRDDILPANQLVATTPWIIERSSLSLLQVKDAILAVKEGRQLVVENDLQAELPFK